jgi:Family of unknown function (DUF6286)
MRVLNRPLAFILAAAVAVASIIVIIEVIAAAAHHGPVVMHWTTWYRWSEGTRWDTRAVQVWSAILIVIGLLVLALELKPPRVTRLRLHAGHQATDAALTRGGLAGALRAAATSIDGITGAAVTVRRGRALVSARAAARGRTAADALKQPVTDAVRSRLDGLDMNHPPHLKVRVTPGSR